MLKVSAPTHEGSCHCKKPYPKGLSFLLALSPRWEWANTPATCHMSWGAAA